MIISEIKTLVFSPKVVLDGMPAGFSGSFKMLHMETGQLYQYRVHVPKHVYVGTQMSGCGSREEDLKWWQCMFYGLTKFIADYNNSYGHLPSDQNTYNDRRGYTSDRQPFGEKIQFVVEEKKRRFLEDKQVVLYSNTTNNINVTSKTEQGRFHQA
ncbi:hypothetical protein [Dyadobacter sp. CY356]|uniref:hypothetical protein n=1 Tax=Dyadobacter sp. CY356 TaxID=2906442 RepID=UPI001F3F12E8|nr:hypothetical protein [Dyadobacter sp. CY356]MCF0054526.1 hypothetical protein [Dyadobacter sp. CY356]